MKTTYGRWTVLSRAGTDKHRAALWLCRCICGVTRPVLGPSLTSGRSTSCGCLRIELKAQRNRDSVKPLAVRFWANVNKHGPLPSPDAVRVHPEIAGTRCWLWTGTTDNRYGLVTVDTRHTIRIHRVAWFLATGEWPKPYACHKCDTRLCVRKLHLFEGTVTDNNRDCTAKGRGRWKK
jgi:hypothetical protein